MAGPTIKTAVREVLAPNVPVDLFTANLVQAGAMETAAFPASLYFGGAWTKRVGNNGSRVAPSHVAPVHRSCLRRTVAHSPTKRELYRICVACSQLVQTPACVSTWSAILFLYR